MNPVKNRVKMTEMMFEKYGFEGSHIDIQALLVLYSQGSFGVGVATCHMGVWYRLPHLTLLFTFAGSLCVCGDPAVVIAAQACMTVW